MQLENIFLVLARKGVGDQVPDPVEEKITASHRAGRRTGERNEYRALMKLYCLLELSVYPTN